MIACGKDEPPVTVYPTNFTLDHNDQTDEGQYLVTGALSVSDLSINIGTYGAHRDSLKTEVRKKLESTFGLSEINLLSDTTLELHYTFNGNPVITPLSYSKVDGVIIIPDPFFSGLVGYDKATNTFILCVVTPFALPGPNAINPTGPSYLNFNITQCIAGHVNRDYAISYIPQKNLQVSDTVPVLVTRYYFK